MQKRGMRLPIQTWPNGRRGRPKLVRDGLAPQMAKAGRADISGAFGRPVEMQEHDIAAVLRERQVARIANGSFRSSKFDSTLLRPARYEGTTMSADDDDDRDYKVVVNHEEQYSIWLSYRDIPLGWRDAGFQGKRKPCLDWIAEVWTDMRPLSLRRAMDQKTVE